MSDSKGYYVPHETKWPFLNTVALIVLFIGLANYMNGCSWSIAYTINKKPIGIMLNGTTKNDDQLLEVGSKIEEILEL